MDKWHGVHPDPSLQERKNLHAHQPRALWPLTKEWNLGTPAATWWHVGQSGWISVDLLLIALQYIAYISSRVLIDSNGRQYTLYPHRVRTVSSEKNDRDRPLELRYAHKRSFDLVRRPLVFVRFLPSSRRRPASCRIGERRRKKREGWIGYECQESSSTNHPPSLKFLFDDELQCLHLLVAWPGTHGDDFFRDWMVQMGLKYYMMHLKKQACTPHFVGICGACSSQVPGSAFPP